MRNILAALLLAATPAGHAAERCTVPASITPAPVTPQEEMRILPVTRLVLAYYWWPQECQRPDSAAEAGCKAGFGFKVHGLWPDGAGRTYPQFCRAPTPLDPATLRANYCMTPSTSLLQHEWAKHGTCHWASQTDYFGAARRVADKITMPAADALPAKRLTAGALRDAIIAANPSLPRASVFVGTDRKQWLTEVRVCLTLEYAPTTCEAGDSGAPDRVPIRVRPRG
jgi:ribonuclease T2